MHDELLTIEDLDANTRRLASDPRVTITPVGKSRHGRVIEMISLGQGAARIPTSRRARSPSSG
jgi:hypothetical protein